MPDAADALSHMKLLSALLKTALQAESKSSTYLEENNFSTRLNVPLRLTLWGSEVTVPAGVEVLFWQGKAKSMGPSLCTIFDRLNERQITVRRDGTLSYRKVRNYNGTPAS